ncbi:hypothetical protein ACFLXI_07530 [Chloroflexota bacterium]
MKTKWLGWLSLVTLISVTLWLVLLIWDMATAGPLVSFEQVLVHIGKSNWKYYFTYLNAGVFTLCVIALMAGLYGYCRTSSPEWSIVGLVFVPVFGTINLIAYLSQITLVPSLLKAASDPVMANAAFLLLQQSIHILPGSTVGFFNGLAYAILGIPSIIFGWALTLSNIRPLRISGWLLLINGVTCILGLFGILIGSEFLSLGTVIGGAIFWLSLFPMTNAFLRIHDE